MISVTRRGPTPFSSKFEEHFTGEAPPPVSLALGRTGPSSAGSAHSRSLKAVTACVTIWIKAIGGYAAQAVKAYDGNMPNTLKDILSLIRDGDVVVSNHGYDELAEDSLTVREILASASDAVAIEDYPDYPKGPCVLVLQRDAYGKPIHVVWAVPAGSASPAVLVTAYRPDPDLWSADFLRREP